MSEEQPYGYIYRVERADWPRLANIIAECVGASGWTFGGAAQWDFAPQLGRDNLRPIIKFPREGALDPKGDFGHAFSQRAEVRWKRRDDGAYDVLILSEKEQTIEGAKPLHIGEAQHWRIRKHKKAAIIQTAHRPAIRYIDYLVPNGAVQFQRLVEVQS